MWSFSLIIRRLRPVILCSIGSENIVARTGGGSKHAALWGDTHGFLPFFLGGMARKRSELKLARLRDGRGFENLHAAAFLERNA